MSWYQPTNFSLILGFLVFLGLSFFAYKAANVKYDKKKTEIGNKSSCRRVQWEQNIRNWTDYFWSNSMRFAWITLALISFITYGIVLNIYWDIDAGAYISIFFSIVALLFFIFAARSFHNFPKKANDALTEFENAIKSGIQKETNYDGDMIQQYTKEINEHEEHMFDFIVGPKKIDFPPFESRPPKKPVFSERKLEFLFLSKEFFSICQGATKFNLLNPEKLPPKKKCAIKKAAGACKEYYYSQVKNVTYENEFIVIYFNNGDEPIKYSCPKRLGKHAKIIGTFRDKLRITERQRLSKVDEQKKFIDIKVDRDDTSNEENESSDSEE